MINTNFINYRTNLNYYNSPRMALSNQIETKMSIPEYKEKQVLFGRSVIKELPKNYQIPSIYHTFFFRDYEIFECLKELLIKFFPNGTHTANFGCSIGKETRTYIMILDDINKNNKYPITGYDIDKNIIEVAKNGKYFIPYSNDIAIINPSKNICCDSDSHLITKKLSAPIEIKEKFNHYSEIFYKYFERLNDEVPPDFTEKVPCFRAKNELFSMINFEKSDVRTFEPKSIKDTGVIIFKNVWYQLHKNDEKKLDVIKSIVEKFYNTLPDNGFLVCGNYMLDHSVCKSKFDFSFDSTAFHKILKDAGFQPVMNIKDIRNTKYPPIWQKTSK